MKVTVETEVVTLDRLSRTQTYIAIALVIAMRGTCQRAQVGCVITQDNRIVATGYNGSMGNKNCSLECDIDMKCKDAVHAEVNAIAFAAKHGIKLSESVLYCTHAPCYECAKLVIQTGIFKVVFNSIYETDNGMGIKILRNNGIIVEQYAQ